MEWLQGGALSHSNWMENWCIRDMEIGWNWDDGTHTFFLMGLDIGITLFNGTSIPKCGNYGLQAQ